MLYSNQNFVVEEKNFVKDGKEIKINYIRIGEEGRGRKHINISTNIKEEWLERGINKNITVATTRSGKPKLINKEDNNNLYLIISTLSSYISGAHGEIVGILEDLMNKDSVKTFENELEIMAVGVGAWGMAGRAGYYCDYLLKVKSKDDFTIKIKPSRGKHIYYHISKNEVFKFENWEDYILYMDNI